MTTPQRRLTPEGIEVPPPSPNDVLYRKDEGFAWITLNRPVVLNAIDWSIRRGLWRALEQAKADSEVRAVILHGAGRSFCSGGDLQGTPPDDGEATPGGMEIFMAIWQLPVPVIAAVNGHAVGQGVDLAGICDLTVAAEDAKFGEIQIRHGLQCRKQLHHFRSCRGRGRAVFDGSRTRRRRVIAPRAAPNGSATRENARDVGASGRLATAGEGRTHGKLTRSAQRHAGPRLCYSGMHCGRRVHTPRA